MKARRANVTRVDPAPTRMRWAFMACLAVVLVLALLPPRVWVPPTVWDKGNHIFAFAVLAVLGCRAYPRDRRLVLQGLLAYGGMIEVLQSFTDYRSAEWLDLVADAVGLAAGVAAMKMAALFPWWQRPGG